MRVRHLRAGAPPARQRALLVFDGALPPEPRDTTLIDGIKGNLMSDGPDLGRQFVTLTMAEGRSQLLLEEQWFNDGFHGTICVKLSVIEDGREPSSRAREPASSGLGLCGCRLFADRTRGRGRRCAWPAGLGRARPCQETGPWERGLGTAGRDVGNLQKSILARFSGNPSTSQAFPFGVSAHAGLHNETRVDPGRPHRASA